MKKIKFFFTGLFVVAVMLSCSKNDKSLIGPNLDAYNVETIEPCGWIGETAWSCGLYFGNGTFTVPKGNWATYTPYYYTPSYLVAGKNKMDPKTNMHAAKVYFSSAVEGKITINFTLNEGWRFADVPENVKIEGYDAAPVGINPKPGQFTYKFNVPQALTSFSFDGFGLKDFYGVHVDVERWVECK